MNVIHLQATDLAIAALLVVASAATSFALRLQVHRQLLWAAARMVVQLLLVGLLLRWVFRSGSAPATVLIVLLMIAAAAREVAVRPSERLRGLANYRIGAMVVGASSAATVCLALLTAIQPSPWYDPRYAIPLMGIVLGTVLNSASLALDTFYGGLRASRAAVEARLCLGASLREAFMPLALTSIRRGLIPLINQMSAAGIITLPGIMTGQLLAGMDPLESVKYQILLLFLLTGAGCLASAGAVWLASLCVSDDRQRLRIDRLRDR
ncbi:ABC transporter permease [Acidovorax sp. SUPP2825]|uniref:ABC transporter permease n=1 Tax=Acidovorax sp. SUPP2825 TaxID=2920879 RepID=UPI0023DE2F62|nr:ABC transporter permease [Acidovorax sp. SUPP2825]GKS97557.1 ABC transporter permease [Acidovorax sp. SUPP2825]